MGTNGPRQAAGKARPLVGGNADTAAETPRPIRVTREAQGGASALMRYLLSLPHGTAELKDFQRQMTQVNWEQLSRTLDYLLQYHTHERQKWQRSMAPPIKTAPSDGVSVQAAASYDRWVEREEHVFAMVLAILRTCLYKVQGALKSHVATDTSASAAKFRYAVAGSLLDRIILAGLNLLASAAGSTRLLALRLILFVVTNAGTVPESIPTTPMPPSYTPRSSTSRATNPWDRQRWSPFAYSTVQRALQTHSVCDRLLTLAHREHDYAPRQLMLRILLAASDAFYGYLVTSAQLSRLIELMIRDHDQAYGKAHLPLANQAKPQAYEPFGRQYFWSPACSFQTLCTTLLLRLFRADPTTVNAVPAPMTANIMKLWRHLATVIMVHDDPPTAQKRLFSHLTEIVVFMCQQLSTNCYTFSKSQCQPVCSQLTIQVTEQILSIAELLPNPAAASTSTSSSASLPHTGTTTDQRVTDPAAHRSHFRWLWWALKTLLRLININTTNGIYFGLSETIADSTLRLLQIFVAHRFRACHDGPSPKPQPQKYVPPVARSVTDADVRVSEDDDQHRASADPTSYPDSLSAMDADALMDEPRDSWDGLAVREPLSVDSLLVHAQNVSFDTFGVTLHAAVPLIYEILQLFSKTNHFHSWSDRHPGIVIVLFSLFIQIHRAINDYTMAQPSPLLDASPDILSVHLATCDDLRRTRTTLLRLFYDMFRNHLNYPLDVFPHDQQVLGEASYILLTYIFNWDQLDTIPGEASAAASWIAYSQKLRYEALRAVSAMIKHYQWRAYFATASNGLAFLRYNLTTWIMANFLPSAVSGVAPPYQPPPSALSLPGLGLDLPLPGCRVSDYTLRQTELLLKYVVYMIQEAVIRGKATESPGLARFFILSYNAAIRWTERPTTHCERDILRVILVGLFRGFQCAHQDTVVLTSLYWCPLKVAAELPGPGRAREWSVTGIPSRDERQQVVLQDGIASFVTCLIHVLHSWSTTTSSTATQGATPMASHNAAPEYMGSAPFGDYYGGEETNTRPGAAQDPRTEELVVTSKLTSFRDIVLCHTATMLKQLLAVPKCLAHIALNAKTLGMIGRRWRDTKYDTEGLGKLLLAVMTTCIASEHWFEMVRHDVLSPLFTELMGQTPSGQSTSSPTLLASPPVPGVEPSSNTALPSLTSPSGVVETQWSPSPDHLQPLLMVLQRQLPAVQMLRASMTVDAMAVDSAHRPSITEGAIANALVYCCPPLQRRAILFNVSHDDNENRPLPPLVTKAGEMHQCPLGTVLRLLVPDPETLENLDRDLGLDWCEPLNRFSTTALYGHLGIPHISLPPSYGSRRIFQSLWSTTNAPSFWSACQAVHFLAWSQQPQWDHEVQHYTLAMQARCQECLPGLMDQVAALTDPVYALVTCEEPEKPVALAPTFWLRDLAQSDPMASCQSLLPGCRATTSPAATPTALQILHASQLPVVNSTEYAQLVASVPLVTYWFYREANAPTASGNRVRITLPIALGRLLSPAFRVMLQPPYVESQTGNVWVFDPDLQHWLVMLDLLYVAIQLRHFGRLSPNQYPWNQGDKEDYTELIQGGYYDSGSHPSPAAGVSSAKASSTTSFVMPTGSTSDSSGPSNRSNTLLSQADSASAFLTWIFPMNVTRGARIRRLLQWSDYWLVDSIKYACITWILEQFTSHAAVQSSSTYSPRQHRHHQSPHTPHFPSSSTLVSPSLTTGVHHTPPAPAALSLISDSSVFSGLGPTSAPPPPALLSSPTAYSRGLAHQFPGSASVAPQSALFPPNTTYIQELLVWFLYFTLSPHTDQSEPLLECLTRLILLSFPRVAPMDGFLQLLWSPSAAADQTWNRIARLLVT